MSRAAASPAEQAVTAERCAAQLLCGDPARSAEEVAWRLLAVQAQDPRGARLTFRARSAGLSASDVDADLASRSMIVSWLNRGTLHLVRTEDYWWLHPLTAPQAGTGNARRLAQEGVPLAQMPSQALVPHTGRFGCSDRASVKRYMTQPSHWGCS